MKENFQSFITLIRRFSFRHSSLFDLFAPRDKIIPLPNVLLTVMLQLQISNVEFTGTSGHHLSTELTSLLLQTRLVETQGIS